MIDYVLHGETATAVITPYAMALISDDLFKMCRSYTNENNIPLAKYYVHCASIEIGLKSAILAKKCTKEQKKFIKELGHNLEKVAINYEQMYSPIWDSSEWGAVKQINKYFLKKDLEYFTIEMMGVALRGYKSLPDLNKVESAARKVNDFLNENRYFIDVEIPQT